MIYLLGHGEYTLTDAYSKDIIGIHDLVRQHFKRNCVAFNNAMPTFITVDMKQHVVRYLLDGDERTWSYSVISEVEHTGVDESSRNRTPKGDE